jgi:hypothetical protein
MVHPVSSPFHLDDEPAYRRWREEKLAAYPPAAADLIVEVSDPRALTAAEHAALLSRVRKTNMAIYAAAVGADPDKAIPRGLGRQFGLERLDHNYLADEDAITSITVNPEGDHPNFIPYTNRPIKWHTDGYYNTGEDQIRAMVLHCVQPAAEGGGNALLDHEIAYLLLRDEDPALIHALMQPDIMTIPARVDEDGIARDEATGPVFSVDRRSGALHMRYTARKRNIVWKDDAASRAAVARLEALLDADLPYIYCARLEVGMGLLCNNVLHDRAGFTDLPGHPKRLLYRARYFDRIVGS